MSYIDGFLLAVPTANKDRYREMAEFASSMFREWGAIRQVETWGDDVPDGKVTSFPMAVKMEADETVVFSWIEWPDKATRDAAHEKMMSDPRMEQFKEMPFDGMRMIFGGFVPIMDVGAGG
ncbi:MAG: DUF1428 domain-containing protein [Minwuia sp.]|uniref:DUF1428 domain-containing protein n=1 Tax=Minwuia sp. TaxID=2493630 RepID=UPI003A8C3BC4